VFIQSFEVGNLKQLNEMTKVRLVQLLSATGAPFDFVANGDPRTYADLITPEGLREVARYADGIGPDKNMIVPRGPNNELLAPTTLVADAHRAGLLVHPYTFRIENTFLPSDFQLGNPAAPDFPIQRGAPEKEFQLFFRLGIDGLFTDDPDTAVGALKSLRGK